MSGTLQRSAEALPSRLLTTEPQLSRSRLNFAPSHLLQQQCRTVTILHALAVLQLWYSKVTPYTSFNKIASSLRTKFTHCREPTVESWHPLQSPASPGLRNRRSAQRVRIYFYRFRPETIRPSGDRPLPQPTKPRPPSCAVKIPYHDAQQPTFNRLRSL